MVRPRSLVLLIALLSASASPAAETTPKGNGPPAPPLERRPYTIRAWVSADPAARLDDAGRARLVAGWRTLARRFVGPAWELEIADGPGPLAVASLEDATAEQVAAAAEGKDKGWLIRVGPARSGYTLEAREFDGPTGQLGPVHRRAAPHPDDAARELLRLSLDVFGPSGEVAGESGAFAFVDVQAGALPPPDPAGRLVGPGTVFRVQRAYLRPDGSTIKQKFVRATYLRVEAMEGARARCSVVSAISNPLTRQVVQRNRLLAVGVRPSDAPTRLRFVLADADRTPLAGYTLTARTNPDAPPRVVGLTDREGRISLPPGLADNLVVLRLLAANVEPLIEFPLMPGELTDEKTFLLPDNRAAAVALETRVNALRDEVIDLVARRARFEARLKARAEGEVWDEVRALLDVYRKLPGREAMARRLQQLEDEGRREQTPRNPVLTRSAQALLADTRGLIEGYLNDDLDEAYADALRQAQSEQERVAKGSTNGPAPASRPAAMARDDAERIQGTWRLVGRETDGQPSPGRPTRDQMPTQSFHGGRFEYSDPAGVKVGGAYELEPRQTPKAIDFLYDGQAAPGLGIYELDGDRLVICAAAPGQPRPTLFVTRPSSGHSLYRYERILATAPDAAPAASPANPQPQPDAVPTPRPKPAAPPAPRPKPPAPGGQPF